MEQHIIFYGAGRQAEYLFSGKIEGKNTEIPKIEDGVCFADADERKWETKFLGLPVMHITKALEVWSDAQIYIALGFPVKYSVIGYLTETLNIAPERIINYEPVEKYASCEYLQGYLCVNDTSLGMCFNNFGRNEGPIIKMEEGTEAKVKAFVAQRDKIIEAVKNGEAGHACHKCRDIQVRYWPKNQKIKYLYVEDFNGCNIHCSYCKVSKPLTQAKKPENGVNYKELIEYLDRENLIDEDFRCSLVAGEISVHPNRQEILDAVYKYPAFICSNALLYNEQIGAILRRGISYLYVSMDSGTKETFAKIKGIDAYERVCQNLKKYAEDGALELKYIVLPGINDNKGDAKGFFELCKSLSVQNVVISRNYDGWIEINDKQLEFMIEMYAMFMNEKIPVSIPSWQYSESENKRIDEELKKAGYVRY